MASTNTTSPTLIVPSPAQAALALAIIRSKPPHCSVRDHMRNLRDHLRLGKSPVDGPEAERYLDLVAYWQEQHNKTREECDRLRSVNIKLQRSNQLLTDLASPPLESAIVPQSSKRSIPTASQTRSSKRPRPTPSSTTEKNIADTREAIEHDSNFLDTLGDDGARLTEALFTTHSFCRASSLDAEKLGCSLVQTSSALGKVIDVIAQHYDQLSRQGRGTSAAASLDRDKSDFSAALSICAKAFMSVLIGMSKLHDSDADTRLASVVICELVGMFDAALRTIETSARQTAHSIISQPTGSTSGKPSKPSARQVKESVPARAVAHLLIGYLGLLDKTDPIHQKLFDGFTFMLLEHIGKHLYYCTFGQHRNTAIENNITPVAQANDREIVVRQQIEALAVRLEVKALVLILERAMGLAPNHMNHQNSRAAKNSNRTGRTLSMKSLSTASRTRLSPLAKDRLQRTLVACMYGIEPEDEFLDVLTKPLPPVRLGSLSNISKVEDAEVNEWYKQEVWRLVGWDILAREEGW